MLGRRRFSLAVGGLVACRAKSRELRLRALLAPPAPPPAAGAGLLLAGTLPPRERRDLLEAVEALLASLEARRSPLLVDLAESSPRELFAGRKAWLGPCVHVARAITRNAYPLGGGEAAAEVVVAAREEGIAAWGDRDGRDRPAELRRAAWTWSSALVVTTRSTGEATRAAAALAPLAIVPNGLVGALWTDAGASSLSREIPPSLLERGARWAERLRNEPVRPDEATDPRLLRELSELFDPPSAAGLLPFWERAASDLLVVPRRGAVARTNELRAAITAALRDVLPAGRYLLRG